MFTGSSKHHKTFYSLVMKLEAFLGQGHKVKSVSHLIRLSARRLPRR